MANPRVSVCIPTYNQAHYLGCAIESVLAQTLEDSEVIVFDDASTDETARVVERFRDPRVRYFRQPHNVGIAANRASCLSHARGRYIAWLDGDDVYYPHMLQTQSSVLDANPRVGLVHGSFHVINEAGSRLPDWSQPFSESVIEPGDTAFRELIVANYLVAPTVMTRRQCQIAAGGYTRRLRASSEDWDMWLRMALQGDVAYTADPVAQYRQHNASSSARTVASGARLRADVRVIEGLFHRRGLAIPDRDALHAQARSALAFKALLLAGEAYMVRRRTHSLSLILTALRLVPTLAALRETWLVVLATVTDREFARYREARRLLGVLHQRIAGSRFGTCMQKVAVVDPIWEQSLVEVAARVGQVVPRDALVAVVDKGDPTILHLSGRRGVHFPDWRGGPGGYPKSSDDACAELEKLRGRGIGYLVFPVSSLWWKDAYPDFYRHVSRSYHCMWDDQTCVIYQLPTGGCGRFRRQIRGVGA